MHYPVYLWWSDEDKVWVAEVPDLPGLMAHGKTEAQAIREAGIAVEGWLEAAAKEDRAVSAPASGDPSGKLLLRIPRSLHRRLQIMAKRENVPLNQLLISLLSSREASARGGR